MGSTPNWDIYYLENGDPQSQITESGVQAGTIEDALDQVGGNVESVNNFGIQYFINASARDLALPSPTVGWLTQLDSELFMRRWDGSAWKPYGSGLYPVRPSSVAGAGVSIDSLGRVVFTAATAANVNGVFSSDFRDYVLEYDMTAASTDVSSQLRLRASGTDAVTDYVTHYTFGSGTTTTTAPAGDTTTTLLQISTGRQTTSGVTIRRPALASSTMFRTQFGGMTNAGTGFEGVIVGRHTPANAYDGFTVFPTSGTFTGTVRIFGMA